MKSCFSDNIVDSVEGCLDERVSTYPNITKPKSLNSIPLTKAWQSCNRPRLLGRPTRVGPEQLPAAPTVMMSIGRPPPPRQPVNAATLWSRHPVAVPILPRSPMHAIMPLGSIWPWPSPTHACGQRYRPWGVSLYLIKVWLWHPLRVFVT